MKKLLKKNQLMITALAIMIAIAGYLQYAKTDREADSVEANGSGAQTVEYYTEYPLDDFIGTGNDIHGHTSEADDAQALIDVESLELDAEDLELAEGTDGLYDFSDLEFAEGFEDEGSYDEEFGEALSEDLTLPEPETGEIPGEAVFTGGEALSDLTDICMQKEQVRAKNKETLTTMLGNELLSSEQHQQALDELLYLTRISENEMNATLLLEAKGFTDAVVNISATRVDIMVAADTLTDTQLLQIQDIVERTTGFGPENMVISTVVK